MTDQWIRKPVAALRPVDMRRLKRLGQQLYPAQDRVDSFLFRAALIALELSVAENGGVMPARILAQMQAEKDNHDANT